MTSDDTSKINNIESTAQNAETSNAAPTSSSFTTSTSPTSAYQNVITDPTQLSVAGAPKDLTSYNDYNNAINTLQNTANDAQLLGSQSGQQTLLQQNYARPDYSQGQQQLDQLLLGGNQANQQQFSQLQNNLLGANPNDPSSNQQVSDYTQYSGPATTIQGQEANAQYGAANYLGGAQANLGNNYNDILSYLYGSAVPTLTNNTAAIGSNVNGTNSALLPQTSTTVAPTALAPGALTGGYYGDVANNVNTDVSNAQAQRANDAGALEQGYANAYYQNAGNDYWNTFGPNMTAAQYDALNKSNPDMFPYSNAYNNASDDVANRLSSSFYTPGQVLSSFQNPSYISSTDGGAAVSNAASAQDIAKIQALNSLAGTGLAPAGSPTALNINGSVQNIGSGFDPNNINFNSSAAWQNLLGSATGAQKAYLDAALNGQTNLTNVAPVYTPVPTFNFSGLANPGDPTKPASAPLVSNMAPGGVVIPTAPNLTSYGAPVPSPNTDDALGTRLR